MLEIKLKKLNSRSMKIDFQILKLLKLKNHTNMSQYLKVPYIS
jgi:hypothetical protein